MFNIKALTALLLWAVSVVSLPAFAQVKPSTAAQSKQAIEQRHKLRANSLLKEYPARSIGPVVQGARIVDLAVDPRDSKHFYVAYASGGIFETSNNGLSFEPVFDNQGAMTIGDIAVAPSDPDVMYVGTGENNSSRSSYAGSGVYKSTDAGKSWQYLGLDNIQHTGRIIVHPQDPNTVWVASMGALYSTNEERGIYKSTDGGQNWKRTLYINDRTGIIDLVVNPQKPEQLWAAAWERSRSASHFKGSGPNSGIYLSEDGGKSWQKAMEGFPDTEELGRIGLAVSPSEPSVLYAVMDNLHEEKKELKEAEESVELQLQDLAAMTRKEFRELEDEKLEELLRKEKFPEKYTAQLVKQQVEQGDYEPKAIAEYFGDANAALFETSVIGAEVYRSEDAGKSWKKVNEHSLEGVFFTYGYYFGEIRVAPDNSDEIYVLGMPLIKSMDGGKHFTRIDTTGEVHVDHQAMWINPEDSEHVMLGNDGGLYISYDAGANWWHINNTSVGQFYTVNVDMETPYNVYGGLQDNGTLMGSSQSVPNKTEKWKKLFGGDGMFVAADPRNSQRVYAGFQFGNYYRINRATDKYTYITPKHDIGEPQLRFNWRTPLIMSKHNPDILYIGAQKIYRSLNRGESWQAISGDLTKDLPQGNVPYSTLSSISESPSRFGLIYAGTDDGNLHVTKNGGADWELISEKLPQDLWVSSVMASPHNEATVFVSLTGYRYDNFSTYLYRSDDYGQNWQSLKGNLPDEAVNVIVQDPVKPDLLYVGTDHGTYVSLNNGQHWEYVYQIPNAAAYDMIVHPRENDLVVATHGRSVYVLDVEPLQALKDEEQALKVFQPENLRHSSSWGERRFEISKVNKPSMSILYYVGNEEGEITAEIYNEEKELLRRLKADNTQGFNQLNWDVMISEYKGRRNKRETGERQYAPKGKYIIKLSNGQQSDETSFEIK